MIKLSVVVASTRGQLRLVHQDRPPRFDVDKLRVQLGAKLVDKVVLHCALA